MNTIEQRRCLPIIFFALAAAGTASAQQEPGTRPIQRFPPVEPVTGTTLTANVTLASQYVSRGFQQTWGQPALQGGFDYTHPSGFFAGTWMSSVSPKWIQDGFAEWDLYTGYGGTVGDVAYKAQLYYYLYPGAKLKAPFALKETKYDYGEMLVGATWKWFTVNYWYTYTKDYFGYNSDTLFIGADQHSRGSGYLDANFNYDFGGGYGLLLHYGSERVKNFSSFDFSDYKVSLTKGFDKGWSTSINYTGMPKVNEFYKHNNTLSVSGDGSFSSPGKRQVMVTVGRAF